LTEASIYVGRLIDDGLNALSLVKSERHLKKGPRKAVVSVMIPGSYDALVPLLNLLLTKLPPPKVLWIKYKSLSIASEVRVFSSRSIAVLGSSRKHATLKATLTSMPFQFCQIGYIRGSLHDAALHCHHCECDLLG